MEGDKTSRLLTTMETQRQANFEMRMYDRIEKCEKALWDSEARNTQLMEAVRKAHEILLHEMDNGRTPVMLQGVGLGYFEDVIAGLDGAQFRRG